MTPYRTADLVQLFQDANLQVRTTALNLLCEGYANDPLILQGIFSTWDRLGIEPAFSDFPMLAYLPASSSLIEEACRRAALMVTGRPLTDPATRAAGKLIEQQLQLPAHELEPHLGLLRETLTKSKIFFRVDLEMQHKRIELLGRTADQLAQRLDTALADHLATQNPTAISDAMLSLEALRRQHPNYLELSAVLRGSPKEGSPAWASFFVTLQSLIQFPQAGLENAIAHHLLDHREQVFSQAVEALVRAGTHEAGMELVQRFEHANARAQQWIARGLQRLRQPGLAAQIAAIETDDAQLRVALFVAQLRQLDTSHTDFGSQLESVATPLPAWNNLLLLNQRLWPSDATTVQDELQRQLTQLAQQPTISADTSSSTSPSPTSSISPESSQQARANLRSALRDQLRKPR